MARIFARETIEEKKKHRQEMVDTIDDELELRLPFLFLLVFSTVIVTLGLLIDNTAVVIGAMLISPIYWPLIGSTLSIITARRKIAERSAIMVVVSLVSIVFVSFITAKLIGITEITDEISLRTSPTLIDLLIALASSMIGVLSLYYQKISSTAAGVAVSVSLLPPLAVTGIGLAFGSGEIISGSLLLFASNAGAILFLGAITMYLLNFKPIGEDEHQRFQVGVFLAGLFLVMLFVPLTLFFTDSIKTSNIKNTVSSTLRGNFIKQYEGGEIDSIKITYDPKTEGVKVKTVINLPEGRRITSSQKQELQDDMEDKLDTEVDLEIGVIYVDKI